MQGLKRLGLVLTCCVLAAMVSKTPSAEAQRLAPTQAQGKIIPQVPMTSTCLAIAEGLPNVQFASLTAAIVAANEVRITYSDHSTYVIESEGGVSIATDFAGYLMGSLVPTAVTMNQAHSTHFTDYPDPAIKHVFRGWNPEGGPARHNAMVGDVLVRNVPTDIVRGTLRIPDGNSIFIFETAGLCVGHLGHLHHMLTDAHFAQIGRLDIVMVPVDGGMTMTHTGMTEIVKRLRSSIILPMHSRGIHNLQRFIAMMGDTVELDIRGERSLTASLNTLPHRPTLVVLEGH